HGQNHRSLGEEVGRCLAEALAKAEVALFVASPHSGYARSPLRDPLFGEGLGVRPSLAGFPLRSLTQIVGGFAGACVAEERRLRSKIPMNDGYLVECRRLFGNPC